jgi:hypothetical protein
VLLRQLVRKHPRQSSNSHSPGNPFNHAQFNEPYNFLVPGDVSFGESLSTVICPDGTTGAREIQFAFKLIF